MALRKLRNAGLAADIGSCYLGAVPYSRAARQRAHLMRLLNPPPPLDCDPDPQDPEAQLFNYELTRRGARKFPPHGRYSTYVRGCRCRACRNASAMYHRERRARVIVNWYEKYFPSEPERSPAEPERFPSVRAKGPLPPLDCSPDPSDVQAQLFERWLMQQGRRKFPPHGRKSTYTLGCRCRACRNALAMYHRERAARARAKRTEQPPADSPARPCGRRVAERDLWLAEQQRQREERMADVARRYGITNYRRSAGVTRS
jgi:hypothetical protein